MSTSVCKCERDMQNWGEPEQMPKSGLFGVCLVKHTSALRTYFSLKYRLQTDSIRLFTEYSPHKQMLFAALRLHDHINISLIFACLIRHLRTDVDTALHDNFMCLNPRCECIYRTKGFNRCQILSLPQFSNFQKLILLGPIGTKAAIAPSMEDGRNCVDGHFIQKAPVFELSSEVVRGLSICRWPGRAQIFHYSSSLVYQLDGAHSPESMQHCITWFKQTTANLNIKQVLRPQPTGMVCFAVTVLMWYVDHARPCMDQISTYLCGLSHHPWQQLAHNQEKIMYFQT